MSETDRKPMDWDDIRQVRIHARAAEAEVARLTGALEYEERMSMMHFRSSECAEEAHCQLESKLEAFRSALTSLRDEMRDWRGSVGGRSAEQIEAWSKRLDNALLVSGETTKDDGVTRVERKAPPNAITPQAGDSE